MSPTFGKLLLGFYQGLDMRRCGLHKKKQRVEEYTYTYLDSQRKNPSSVSDDGKEDVVVHVHGFGADSASMLKLHVALANLYRKGYKVGNPAGAGTAKNRRQLRAIIPDLLGHGETTPDPADGDFSVAKQVEYLNKFLQNVIGDAKFHLVGTSMGGFIAGTYAATYPDHCLSLTFLCPAGLNSPKTTPYVELRQQTGRNILLPKDLTQMREMFNYLFHRQPWIPGPVQKEMLRVRLERMEVLKKIAADLLASPKLDERRLSAIAVPTIVLWGEKDQIISPSCVDVLREGLQHLKLVEVYEDCGHVIAMERPLQCANAILTLIRNAPEGRIEQ